MREVEAAGAWWEEVGALVNIDECKQRLAFTLDTTYRIVLQSTSAHLLSA